MSDQQPVTYVQLKEYLEKMVAHEREMRVRENELLAGQSNEALVILTA